MLSRSHPQNREMNFLRRERIMNLLNPILRHFGSDDDIKQG